MNTLAKASGRGCETNNPPRNTIPTRLMIEWLREAYPKGTRVELVEMEDPQAPPVGTQGTVIGADGIGSLLVKWDTGSSLNVLYGIDTVRKMVQP